MFQKEIYVVDFDEGTIKYICSKVIIYRSERRIIKLSASSLVNNHITSEKKEVFLFRSSNDDTLVGFEPTLTRLPERGVDLRNFEKRNEKTSALQ